MPISIAGQRGRKRFTRQIAITVKALTPTVAGLIFPAFSTQQASLPMKPAGMEARPSPSRSLSWVAKITTAIPEVKPVVTGNGMNLISAPIRNAPNKIRMIPAIIVAASSPASPNLR